MYGLWSEEPVQPIVAIFVLWLLWFLGLIAAALWSSRRTRRLHPAQEISYRALVIVGGLLLFSFTPWPGLDVQYLLWRPVSGIAGWLLVALTFEGFVFAFWGRIRVAAESGMGDHIIDTGPYKIVRHPIYTGVIIAAFSSAIVLGKPSSMAGAALLTIAFLVRILIEEGALRSDTGSYSDYTERVPMLVPKLPAFLTARLWGERFTPSVPPALTHTAEEKPAAIDLLPPTPASEPVAARGVQMSLPLAEPVTMVQSEPAAQPATQPVNETTADESEAPAADEPDAPVADEEDTPVADEEPAQPELSEAISMTKR
jgi:protein-S-isoprenylcysteine O-methyltransferase Ste14